jgi:hypothetical protein
LTTAVAIRDALRPLLAPGIDGALAGKFQLDTIADAGRTRGVGVLFIPVAHIGDVQAFLTALCGQGPTETKVSVYDHEGN